MRLYTALYDAFMSPLYAGTLYQGLYQVYATRSPLSFKKRLPGRGLPVVAAVSLWSPCGLPRPPAARRGLAWLRLASIGLAVLPLAVLALALPVFRSACMMAAYAVALFCFLKLLYSTRGLPCPGRSWGQHQASLQLV